jgi:hypothetical protein
MPAVGRSTTRDDFRERCQQAVAGKIDALFENDRARAFASLSPECHKFLILEAPGIKFRYSATDDELVGILKVLARDALIAYVQFHLSKPPGFPELPITPYACEDMKARRDKRAHLVGCYGTSQMRARWDKKHPMFRPFCRGLMADARTSKRLRNDSQLRQMFPPKQLRGLVQGSYWCSPATLDGWINLVARIDASVRQPVDNVLMVEHVKHMRAQGIFI